VEALALHLGLLGVDFTVTEPTELVDHVRMLADRYQRATEPSPQDAQAGSASRVEEHVQGGA